MLLVLLSLFLAAIVLIDAIGVGVADDGNEDYRPEQSERVETVSTQAQGNCPTGDCIAHDISTQDSCKETVETAPHSNTLWHQGLSLQADNRILGGDIVAYKIRWFNGNWSGWFVPGINDIDIKYNHQSWVKGRASHNTMRRMWSYFYDHEHRYIICKAAFNP